MSLVLKFGTWYRYRVRYRTAAGWSTWYTGKFKTRNKDYKRQ